MGIFNRYNTAHIGNESKQRGVASRGTRLLVASRVENQLNNTRDATSRRVPRLATPCCIFRDVTRKSYILLSFPIGSRVRFINRRRPILSTLWVLTRVISPHALQYGFLMGHREGNFALYLPI